MRIGQPEPKRGNRALLAALIALSLVMLTVYFREGNDGMLHSTRRVMLEVTAPIASLGTAITSPIRTVGDFFDGITTSKSTLDALEQQNDELRARLAELEEARQENERLRALVEFAEERGLAKLGARVIRRPVSSWEGVIVIDRGSDDGVEPGMPIISSEGLVGQVAEVSKSASTVRLITDQQSGVAAMVQSTRALGIVRGAVSGGLTLDFLGGEALPQPGDVVLTSGLGGVYPKGIVIGDITDVDSRRGELYPRVVVRSRVSIDTIEEVFVLVGAGVETDGGVIE
jgi:rod shape-determining protein MreC